MIKPDLRKSAKAQRDAIIGAMPAAMRRASAVLVAERVLLAIGEARRVALYLPIGSEVDTLPLISRLEARGVAMAQPHVTGPRGIMRFLAWAPGDPLPAGPMGLRQPRADAVEVEPDLIILPLLAFDSALHRLGYGAGHYDRALAARPQVRRVGLAWDAQRVDVLPVDAWDVPLHAVATEREWIAA